MKTILATALYCATAAAGFAFSPQDLWRLWPEARFIEQSAPCVRPHDLAEALGRFAAKYPGALSVNVIGLSFENRPINLLTLGSGPKRILLWSQMHGDEPSATPALLDIADFLLARRDHPAVREVLESFTLLMIPMLNPDGAERYDRRNAQGIDINRDALNLATPEGRLLKRIRDEHQPILGFNLHDQNRRTTVGNTGVLATNAVLAVAGDESGTLTPGRLRAKRACSAITAALAPFVPGGMARYDEDWSPRAFGDNLTAWGTPVVLIESGGLPSNFGFEDLSRLNFVAILSVLMNLAHNDLADFSPDLYESLQRNERNAWVDVAVRGGSILLPGAPTAFRADLVFNRNHHDRYDAGCVTEDIVAGSRIEEIGDSRFVAAGEEIPAQGSLLIPPFTIAVDGWSARNWLSRDALRRFARLGVGRVQWIVHSESVLDAQDWLTNLNVLGRPQVSVIPAAGRTPWFVVSRSPETPLENSLLAAVAALHQAGDGKSTEFDAREVLEELWISASESREELRVGAKASFVLLRSGEASGADILRSGISSVWIDGEEADVDFP